MMTRAYMKPTALAVVLSTLLAPAAEPNALSELGEIPVTIRVDLLSLSLPRQAVSLLVSTWQTPAKKP